MSSAFRTTLTASPLLCTGRLLDNIPEDNDLIGVAFSLRKVSTAYDGPCIRIRRASDNNETDIGFIQTDIDLETMLDFSSGFDCFVTTWYDQTGQGRHAEQRNPTFQPQIIEKGSVITNTNENRVSMRFNGNYFTTTWEPHPTEMQDGAGLLLTAAAGINGSSQGGTVIEQETSVITKTDYPNTFLPEGQDTFYFEGLKAQTSSGREEIVYTENNTITKLVFDPEDGPKSIQQFTMFYTGSGSTFAFTRTDPDYQPDTDDWYNTVQTLLNEGTTVYIRIIGLSQELFTVTGVNNTDPNAYTVTMDNPPDPQSNIVMQVEVLTNRTPIEKITTPHPVPGGPPTVTVDTLTTYAPQETATQETNQWRRGVKANGRVFAIPYNASSVLEIDHIYSYVKSIQVVEEGSGYDTNPPTITIDYTPGAGEQQATIGAVTYNTSTGGIASISLVSEGKYEGEPSISITGGNNDAVIRLEMSRIRVLSLDGIVSGHTQAEKYWMGVAYGDCIYCIPHKATKVLQINASTTPATLHVFGRDFGASSTGHWADGVLAPSNEGGIQTGGNDCIYGIPYSNTQVLKIDPSNPDNPVISTLSGTFTGIEKWRHGCFANGRIFAVPWSAATILVIEPSSDTVYVRGSTGMTPILNYPTGLPRVSYDRQHRVAFGGRGYTEPPTLTVDPSGHGDTESDGQMQLEAIIEPTRIITDIRIKSGNQGSGYTSSPSRIQFDWGNSGPYVTKTPIAARPSPYKATPTMDKAYNAAGEWIGYKITGITIEHGGDGLGDIVSGTPLPNPVVEIIGGKGTARATAVVVLSEGKIGGIRIKNGGSGYVDWRDITVVIQGGSPAERAEFAVTKDNLVPPQYGNDGNDHLTIIAGGYLQGSLKPIKYGSGYSSVPTVRIEGGKGQDCVIEDDDITQTPDGKIVRVDPPSNGGTGYVVESVADVTSGNGVISIDVPTGPGGIRAIARVKAVGSNNEITEIELVNTGSGYLTDANVEFAPPPGGGTQASTIVGGAKFKVDGRVADVRVKPGTTYYRYITSPTITGLNVRTTEDNASGDITPGKDGVTTGGATAVILNDGRASSLQDPAPFKNNYQPPGYSKFVSAHKYQPPGSTEAKIFSFPYQTHRALRLQIPQASDPIQDLSLCHDIDNLLPWNTFPRGIGRNNSACSGAVADLDNTNFYGVPYSTDRVLRITGSSNEIQVIDPIKPMSFRGRWLDGVAAYNGCIYCVPADSNSLLVIDTNTNIKSETITFTNIRGQQNQKWWSAVMAGSSGNDGMIYGIPSDLTQVLELNPGANLRSKSLPSLGTVARLSSGRDVIVYPPGTKPGTRHVTVFDPDTDTVDEIPIPDGKNCTFVEGVQVQDGNVVFIPVYNTTDEFPYEGRIGIVDPVNRTFEFTEIDTVPSDKGPVYPSRSVVALGSAIPHPNGDPASLVAWVPKEGTVPIQIYDYISGSMLTNADFINFGGRTLRDQDKITFASAQRLGNDVNGKEIVSTVPKDTQVSTLALGYNGGHIAAGILSKRGFIYVIPGYAQYNIRILYPDNPTAERGVTPELASPTRPVTQLNIPDFMLREMQKINAMVFWSAVRYGDTVYCIPCRYYAVMTITEYYDEDTQQLDWGISEITSNELFEKYQAEGDLYIGGIVGGNGKIYCIPYDASQVMVIDPSKSFDQLSFIETNVDDISGYPGTSGKWRNGVLLPDGRIMAAPYNATTILLIDPSNDSVSVYDPGSQVPWVIGSEKYSDIVFTNNRPHLIPHRATSIVSIDFGMSPVEVEETDLKIGNDALIWSAVLGQNGRIYCIPRRINNVVEFNPETKEVIRTGNLSQGSNIDFNKFSASVLAQNGTIYGFPYWRNDVVVVEPFSYQVTRFDLFGTNGNQQTPQYTPFTTIPRAYRLRPFQLDYDPKYLMFHTAGTFSIVDANTRSTSYTQVVSGPSVINGVASHYPSVDDTMVTAFANTITKIYPFEGGIVGAKSFSGTADIYCSIIRQDVEFNLGNTEIRLQGIFDSFFPNSASGVMSSFHSNTANTTNMYILDTIVDSLPGTFDGQIGASFSIGRVEGTKINDGAYNAPGFRQGFNGLISEVVVFTSDQQARARTLNESSTFYFLDSTDLRLTTLQ